MLTLYDFGLSPYAQKVKIALREKGISFDRRNGLIGEGAEELRRLSRRAEVPLLIDGVAIIADSTIILDYLDEKWPDHPILPEKPLRRARIRMLEKICDTELEAIIFNLAELATCDDGPADARQSVAEAGKADIFRLFEILSHELGDRDYFGGREIDRLDICIIPHINAARAMRMAPEQTNLLGWRERMNARKSVASTLAEAKESLGDYKILMRSIKAGEAKRQFRDHRLDWLLRANGNEILQARIRADNIRYSSR